MSKQKGIHPNDICTRVTEMVQTAQDGEILNLILAPDLIQKVTKHLLHNRIADFNTSMCPPSLAGEGKYCEKDHMGNWYEYKTGSRRIVDVAVIPLPSYEGQSAPLFESNGTLNKEYRRFLCDNYRVVLLMAPKGFEAELDKFVEPEPTTENENQ